VAGFHLPITGPLCPPAVNKTEHGAHVGDLFMSLIYTCQFCDANPFDYLTELQKHAAELSSDPAKWMPWNYREILTLA
jgi:transposase